MYVSSKMDNLQSYLSVVDNSDIPMHTNTNVWILGRKYNALQEIEPIRRDVRSRLWCTYRRDFPALGDNELKSDRGWGCMLRCGQMVLAQALIDLHLGRDWFWTPDCRDPTYLQIVSRFEDSPDSLFSIHRIALMGDSSTTIKIGQWFGPNTVAQALKKLARFDDWCSIVVHVSMYNTIVTEDIYADCLENPENDETWKPLLLILPLRLGVNEINPIYIPALKKCFEVEGTCGVIGGRPNQALYFLGYVNDELLYLDPHTTQPSGSVGNKSSPAEIDIDETYHQKYANRINFRNLDPSIALCFLCKSKHDFDALIDKLKSEVLSASTRPLFEISARPLQWSQDGEDDIAIVDCDDDAVLPITGDDNMDNDDDDDFVVI